ncbi:WD40 repeat-like protein, partial [Aureobasidium melanogenum]
MEHTYWTLDTQTGQFASASRDGTIRLWNTDNSQCEKSIVAHEKGVRVWDIFKGHCLQTFKGHSATVHGVVFDSTRLAAGAENGEVRVWNRASGTLLASLNNGNGIPAQIRMRHGTLISTGKNGVLTFWNKSWLGEDHTVLAHDSIIVALYMTDTDLFTGGMDGVVKKWDLQSGNLAQEIFTRYRNLHVIVVDQQVVIAVSTDDAHTALEIWSLASTAPDKSRAT